MAFHAFWINFYKALAPPCFSTSPYSTLHFSQNTPATWAFLTHSCVGRQFSMGLSWFISPGPKCTACLCSRLFSRPASETKLVSPLQHRPGRLAAYYKDQVPWGGGGRGGLLPVTKYRIHAGINWPSFCCPVGPGALETNRKAENLATAIAVTNCPLSPGVLNSASIHETMTGYLASL